MKTKSPDLDDIGFAGIGRAMTEEEVRLASASIQAYMATYRGPRYKPSKRPAADSAEAAPTKGIKRIPAKLRALDDIGFPSPGRPYTEEEARMASAFIQKEKAKRSASRTTARRKTAVRKPKAKTRTRA